MERQNKRSRSGHLIMGIVLVCLQATAQNQPAVTIIDAQHYSQVFGEMRNFRIFLPPGYSNDPRKKYPVIYFMHGWSQRSFGDVGQSYAPFDKGDENKGDNIAHFVSAHDVIVVKSDGYNRNPDEPYYLRPYNVSPVETFRQFPIYYPELINYIDTHYRTRADRGHRAISGLSMGGFMSFWIAGKYPDLFSAAGSFCGSAEFLVGPKDFPVEYRHIDLYRNYSGMKLRLHYGDKDFIRSYHQDMNRTWPAVMDNYSYKIYEAEHSTCGLGEMFNFFLETFAHPPVKPLSWDHVDVYPSFSVWDYQVSSDRTVPGLTILERVNKRGLRCSVKEFLPDGEIMPDVNLSITTPPLYDKKQWYVVNNVDLQDGKAVQRNIQADTLGRLKIVLTGSIHEIGINKKADGPNICIAAIEVQKAGWVTQNKEVLLSIKLVNKGMTPGKNITARLSATGVDLIQTASDFGTIAVNEIRAGAHPFRLRVQSDSMDIQKFKLTILEGKKHIWTEFFELPVKKDLPEIKNIEIADGRMFTVTKSGIDSETVLLGKGNGDGIANPGESIVLLVKDQQKYWRTALSCSDKYVNPFGINIRKSDDWSSFDHVGASAKYSMPVISSDCPENHRIEFFATYWLPEYPYHLVRQGIIKIAVRGKDSTEPVLKWVKVPADNTIKARIYDGSTVQHVQAKFISTDEQHREFVVELNDNGTGGDQAANDQVFSKKIPQQKFGFYRVILEATDSLGNTLTQEVPGKFMLH